MIVPYISNRNWQHLLATASVNSTEEGKYFVKICKELVFQKTLRFWGMTYHWRHEVTFSSGTWQKKGEMTSKFIWDPVGPCYFTKNSLQALLWHEIKFSLLQQKHQESGKFCINIQQATKMVALPCRWGEPGPKLGEEQSLGLLGLTWWCPSKLWSGVSSEGERAEGWCCHRGSLPPSQEGREGKTVLVVLPWVVQEWEACVPANGM